MPRRLLLRPPFALHRLRIVSLRPRAVFLPLCVVLIRPRVVFLPLCVAFLRPCVVFLRRLGANIFGVPIDIRKRDGYTFCSGQLTSRSAG